MDKLGLPSGVALGLRALTVARKVTGRVLTVRLGPVTGAGGAAFVPAGHAARVLHEAEDVAAAEDAMSVRIKNGEAVSRVMSADYERMLGGGR